MGNRKGWKSVNEADTHSLLDDLKAVPGVDAQLVQDFHEELFALVPLVSSRLPTIKAALLDGQRFEYEGRTFRGEAQEDGTTKWVERVKGVLCRTDTLERIAGSVIVHQLIIEIDAEILRERARARARHGP